MEPVFGGVGVSERELLSPGRHWGVCEGPSSAIAVTLTVGG